MFQQIFNNQPVWVLSGGEFIGFVLGLAAVALCLVLFIAITAPVSIPYFKAKLSKDKYLLLVLDKTHRVKFLSAKMTSSVVEAQGLKYAAYVKNDNSGSYNLGAVKMDVISSGNALIHQDQYISAINMMQKLGIESEEDAALLVNERMKLQGYNIPEGYRIPSLADIPKDCDVEVLVPMFNRVSLSDLGRWLKITPETIKGWCESEKDLMKKHLTRKDGSAKSGSPSGLILAIAIGAVALIVVMALMKNGTI